jgi:predicted glutamine amidotransferase
LWGSVGAPAGASALSPGPGLIYRPALDGAMCRLFGQLTARNEPAEPWLVRHDRSLLAQAHATPETAQRDGWGIAWYTATGHTQVERGTGGAFEPGERERFTRAAAEARPPLVVGHLRHASNPLQLPRAELLGPKNSQPFGTHTVLFAHNGSIPFPTETRPFLGVHEKEVGGVNDSEVLFWLLLRHAEELRDPVPAYVHAVEDLVRVRQALGRPPIPAFSGLNVLFSRGPEELYAFCLWTGDHGTGLLDPTRRYYQMAYRASPHGVVVGSEPFDEERGTWSSLSSGQYLVARREDSHVGVTVGPIPLPPGLETGPPAA